MVVNPFFEKTVRIQTDNEHRVIDTGPYAHASPWLRGFLGLDTVYTASSVVRLVFRTGDIQSASIQRPIRSTAAVSIT